MLDYVMLKLEIKLDKNSIPQELLLPLLPTFMGLLSFIALSSQTEKNSRTEYDPNILQAFIMSFSLISSALTYLHIKNQSSRFC